MHRGVESQASRMQLLEDCDVQSLLREQDFNVAAPIRSRHGRVENRLPQISLHKGKRLRLVLARTMSALYSHRGVHVRIRQSGGVQDEAPTTRCFQTQLRVLNDRISL